MNTSSLDKNIQKRFDAVARSATLKHIIAEYSLDKKSVLDVGCTYGEFLCHFGEESTGLTIIPEEAETGQRIGLDVRCGNVEYPETIKLDRQYDAIFANNIFEHMLSPHLFLTNMKKYLKPGGIMILGVPCIPKLTFMLRVPRFGGSLASLHINFFTRDTLIKTVEYGGWTVLACRGFHFKNKLVDSLMNGIWPHFYAVAKPTEGFAYSPKRQKEAAGYDLSRPVGKQDAS